MGAAAGRPSAVVCVSAHWYVPNLSVLSAEFPRTIHDFGGFPEALYALRYPAPGSPEVARRAQALLAEFGGALSDQWGLDHGAWCVLRHIWPDAAVPVVQVSVQRGASAAKHWEFGQRLSALRHEGVVVMGSGNAVHNLRHAFGNMTNPTPQWAAQFDADVASALEQRDRAWLVRALDTDAGRLAHPSADHYLPLLVAAGAAATDPSLSFPVADFDASSISMRSVRWG
jgi:4,5-DOPA dioxygenase extradiol